MEPSNHHANYLIHVFTEDRPGLIAQVSSIITGKVEKVSAPGNISEYICYTLGHMATFFASFWADEKRYKVIARNLNAKFKPNDQLALPIKPIVLAGMRPRPVEIEIDSQDYPGLLRDATSFLADKGMSILVAQGRQYVPERSGGVPYFRQIITARVLANFSAPACKADLQAKLRNVHDVIIT